MANETETAGLSAIAKETKIGLFFPCYVDAFFPQVGIATLELLEKLGCSVEYPLEQTCCGQPIANSGCQEDSAASEAHFVECFKDFDSALAHTPRFLLDNDRNPWGKHREMPAPVPQTFRQWRIAKQEGKMNAREVIHASVRRNLPPVPLPNAPTVAVHGNLPDEQRSTYNFLSTFRGTQRHTTDGNRGVNHGDEDSGVAVQNEAGERKHGLGTYNLLHLASSSAASVI